MKTVISNNDGFKYFVEVNEINHPKGHTHVKFTTEWDGARRDGSEQKQFELFLSSEQLSCLKNLL